MDNFIKIYFLRKQIRQKKNHYLFCSYSRKSFRTLACICGSYFIFLKETSALVGEKDVFDCLMATVLILFIALRLKENY